MVNFETLKKESSEVAGESRTEIDHISDVHHAIEEGKKHALADITEDIKKAYPSNEKKQKEEIKAVTTLLDRLERSYRASVGESEDDSMYQFDQTINYYFEELQTIVGDEKIPVKKVDFSKLGTAEFWKDAAGWYEKAKPKSIPGAESTKEETIEKEAKNWIEEIHKFQDTKHPNRIAKGKADEFQTWIEANRSNLRKTIVKHVGKGRYLIDFTNLSKDIDKALAENANEADFIARNIGLADLFTDKAKALTVWKADKLYTGTLKDNFKRKNGLKGGYFSPEGNYLEIWHGAFVSTNFMDQDLQDDDIKKALGTDMFEYKTLDKPKAKITTPSKPEPTKEPVEKIPATTIKKWTLEPADPTDSIAANVIIETANGKTRKVRIRKNKGIQMEVKRLDDDNIHINFIKNEDLTIGQVYIYTSDKPENIKPDKRAIGKYTIKTTQDIHGKITRIEVKELGTKPKKLPTYRPQDKITVSAMEGEKTLVTFDCKTKYIDHTLPGKKELLASVKENVAERRKKLEGKDPKGSFKTKYLYHDVYNLDEHIPHKGEVTFTQTKKLESLDTTNLDEEYVYKCTGYPNIEIAIPFHSRNSFILRAKRQKTSGETPTLIVNEFTNLENLKIQLNEEIQFQDDSIDSPETRNIDYKEVKIIDLQKSCSSETIIRYIRESNRYCSGKDAQLLVRSKLSKETLKTLSTPRYEINSVTVEDTLLTKESIALLPLNESTNKIVLNKCKLTTEAAKILFGTAKNVKTVEIKECQLQKGALKEMATAAKNIENLNLDFSVFSPNDLQFLNSCKKLKDLDLSRTMILSKHLSLISKRISITKLRLHHTAIKDKGLEYVKELKSLKELDLSKTQVTDQGLKHLEGFTKLEILNLSETKIKGPGLPYLATSLALRSLNLSNTKLDDTGLALLIPVMMGKAKMQKLNLEGTKTNYIMTEAVRALLPKTCKIETSDLYKKDGARVAIEKFAKTLKAKKYEISLEDKDSSNKNTIAKTIKYKDSTVGVVEADEKTMELTFYTPEGGKTTQKEIEDTCGEIKKVLKENSTKKETEEKNAKQAEKNAEKLKEDILEKLGKNLKEADKNLLIDSESVEIRIYGEHEGEESEKHKGRKYIICNINYWGIPIGSIDGWFDKESFDQNKLNSFIYNDTLDNDDKKPVKGDTLEEESTNLRDKILSEFRKEKVKEIEEFVEQFVEEYNESHDKGNQTYLETSTISEIKFSSEEKRPYIKVNLKILNSTRGYIDDWLVGDSDMGVYYPGGTKLKGADATMQLENLSK